MDLERLKSLIRVFEATTLAEMEIEEEGRRVRLTRQLSTQYVQAGVPLGVPVAPQAPAIPSAPPLPETAAPAEEYAATIDSPMVGTFYAASAPSEPVFVKPGDKVEPNQTVCIVEAMKIMNEVVAKSAAVIEKVLVENGQPVEYGQPLFAIRPLA